MARRKPTKRDQAVERSWKKLLYGPIHKVVVAIVMVVATSLTKAAVTLIAKQFGV